jgi:hypothetical protein
VPNWRDCHHNSTLLLIINIEHMNKTYRFLKTFGILFIVLVLSGILSNLIAEEPAFDFSLRHLLALLVGTAVATAIFLSVKRYPKIKS